jgi:hypothetical protein
LGIILEFDDFIDAHLSVFIRNIHIINTRGTKPVKFVYLCTRLSQSVILAVTPIRRSIYRITTQFFTTEDVGRLLYAVITIIKPFDQYTIGLFGIEGKEGTYRDAEDGELGMNNVEHGRVDSTIRFKTNIEANSSARVQYWIAVGTSTRDALYIFITKSKKRAPRP